MKILHINALDSRYGCSIRARAIRDAFRAAGHCAHYAEPNCGDPRQAETTFQSGDNVSGWAKVARRFAQLAREESFDALFVSKPILPTLPAMIAAGRRGAAVLLDCDDLDYEFQSSAPRRLAALAAFRQGCRAADAILTHNRRLAGIIKESTGKQAVIIPQGVDAALFDPAGFDREAVREKLGLGGKKVLGLVATMTTGGARAFPELLEAVAAPLKESENGMLLVVGGGPLLEEMRRMAKQKLGDVARFAGRVAHEDVPQYVAAMDVGLLYMLDDDADAARSSMKLLEYLAMGTPVAARLVGHAAEDFAGMCATASDGEDFARVCIDCLRDPPQRGLHSYAIRRDRSWAALTPMLNDALLKAVDARDRRIRKK
ncbi:MAG TPA: glycosyltransferase [Candidatus Brocadiia bacterium]|nr:glycosyltransferase [Candidatus Brocadiia bacterium]